MLFIVGLTYCWSNGPISAIVVSEIFPQHVRDKVKSIPKSRLRKSISANAVLMGLGFRSIHAWPNRLASYPYSTLAQIKREGRPEQLLLALRSECCCLRKLTSRFVSHYEMYETNPGRQISVYFILPETKNISLERMDKLFGELDFVDAGEQDAAFEKIEARIEATEKDAVGTSHAENVEKKEGGGEEAREKKEEAPTGKAVENPVV